MIPAAFPGEPSPEQGEALRLLRTRSADVKVDFDVRLGSPKWVRSETGFLTGEGGSGGAVPKQAAAGIAANDPQRAAKAFLNEYQGLFGFDVQTLEAARIERDYTDAHNGLHHTVWQQEFNGLPVYAARFLANVTARGQLVSIGSHFVPDLAAAAKAGVPGFAGVQANPPLSASAALVFALKQFVQNPGAITADEAVGPEQVQHLRGAALRGEAQARMAWFPVSAQQLRLAWDLIYTEKTNNEMYRTHLDVQTGVVLGQSCLTGWFMSKSRSQQLARMAAERKASQTVANPPAAAAPIYGNTAQGTANVGTMCTFNVYTSDSPSPFSPGWPTSNPAQPPLVPRTLVTLDALDPVASPNGWVDPTNDTRGNNVDAHTDINADDVPDVPRPVGTGSPLTFDFPLDLAQDPSTYRPAAVTQLFYLCNAYHDKLYGLGFTEAAGNFQNDNFGRGGLGNDAVQADAQDGSGTNNANFATPPDGLPGRMQMYVFTNTNPNRDGDLDAEVVWHEHTHGLSNRLVGGGVGITALQPSGMGEGWSDWYALSLLSESGDDQLGTYPMGGYVSAGMVADNYYRGIRRYPYCVEPGPVVTAASKYPLTFGDIIINTEVHDMGEIWCETLWEARYNIVTKYGYDPGNQMMMQMVTDGMKLAPADPTYLEARDAILLADFVDNGGANEDELWRAFAKRGMGYSAQAGTSDVTSGVVEAFDLPGDLRVLPRLALFATGEPGGPFAPNTQIYTLRNANLTNPLDWTASNTQPWLSLSASGGTLASGASVPVTISLNSNADHMPTGTFTDTVTFTNVTTGSGTQTVNVTLTVAYNYTIAADTFNWIDPTAHPNLGLGDDIPSTAQALPFTFYFYGQAKTQVYVGPNGLLGFNVANMLMWTNSDIPNSATPNSQVYPWWVDLDPSSMGSVHAAAIGVSPNRQYVVSWVGVPAWGRTNPLTFQAILCETSNDIIFQYQEVQAAAPEGAGRGATIGLENDTGLVAKKYSYNGSTLLSNNQAIRFIWNGKPTVMNVTSTLADGAYGAGQVIPVRVTFSEVVAVVGTPQLVLDTGGAGTTVNYRSGTGTNTLLFNYIVAAGDNSPDLDYLGTNALGLNGGTIRDVARINGVLTMPTPGTPGSLSANKDIVVDTVAPTVTNVSALEADGLYGFGQTINVTVTFSEPITVAGVPQLALATGGVGTNVNYSSGSGTDTLSFIYTVGNGDSTPHLDYVDTNALTLSGGLFQDLAKNNAVLTLPAPGSPGSLGANKNLVIDGVLPVVTDVTSTAPDGVYGENAVIDVTVTFGKVIYVTGTPQLVLNTGGAGTAVDCSGGSGTNTLTFSYTVVLGDTSPDLDYLGIGALSLNGGTILDLAANNAVLALPAPGSPGSLGANKDIVIATVAPVVANVSSTLADGVYGIGQVIGITVELTNVVNVIGTPQLTLAINGLAKTVDYSGGNGTPTLTFNYTVAPGDGTPHLDYLDVNSLSVNGGSMRDLIGNDAILALAPPGAARSLGANKNIGVDGSIPAISAFAGLSIQESSTTGPLAFTIGDVDTPFDKLVVSVVSSNQVLVPTAGLVLGGSGADRTVTVTPGADLFGSSTITISVADLAGQSSSSSFVLDVARVNVRPVANPQSISTLENTPVGITLSGDDKDPEVAQVLTFSIVKAPVHGTLSAVAQPAASPWNTAIVTYTPNMYYFGPDSFTYTVTDDASAGPPPNRTSAPATIAISVQFAHQPPVALPQGVLTGLNEPVGVTLAAFEPQNEAMRFAVSSPPANGRLTGTPPVLTYIPRSGYSGMDSFLFTATNTIQTSPPAMVMITITPAPSFQSPPTVVPPAIVAGQSVTVQANAGTATLVWDFGDGTTASGNTATHVYPQPGIYTITVTATSTEGVTTVSQLQAFVGLPTIGRTGVMPNLSILVGGQGLGKLAGGSAKLSVNYLKRDRTSFTASVGKIDFPATLQYATLVGEPAVITVGQGPLAQTFAFTVDPNGKFKATGLPGHQLDLRKKTLTMSFNARPGLTDLFESMGGWAQGVKKGPLQTWDVPVTLQVGNQVFLSLTFRIQYQQNGNAGKGVLAK